MRFVLGATALVSLITVGAILVFLIYFCLPLIAGGQVWRLASWQWQPYQGHFGILPMAAGSLCLAVAALTIAYPLAIGICGLAHGLATRPVARWLLAIVHFMASIPTVIYGLVSVFLLVPLIRQGFSASSGFCLLAAAPTLALLVLPTVVLLIHVELEQVDQRVRLAGKALGLTPAGEFLWVVLPCCKRGLTAAAILGFARAIGDTLISLMVAGNAPRVPASPLDSMRTLTAHIALVVSTDSQSVEYHSLFAGGLILFVVTAAVTLTVRYLRSPKNGTGLICAKQGADRRLVAYCPRKLDLSRFLSARFSLVVSERTFLVWSRLAGVVVAGAVVTIVGFLAWRGGGTLDRSLLFGDAPPVEAVLGRQPVFDGIWPAVVGTLQLIVVASAIAVPLGIGSGIYLAQYASARWRYWLSVGVDLLAGIPSIVMGLFGFAVILFLQQTFSFRPNTCLLLAATCLALLVLPYLIRTTQTSLESVPDEIGLTGLALGMTKGQNTWRVLLPAASRGILSGIVLAVGRIAEDTAVILLTGAVFFSGFAPHRLLDNFEALPYTIFYFHDRYENAAQLDRAFGAALVLLLLTSTLFGSAYWLQRTLHYRWKHRI
jgi:phosphate ABC transporter permease subunit PstA